MLDELIRIQIESIHIPIIAAANQALSCVNTKHLKRAKGCLAMEIICKVCIANCIEFIKPPSFINFSLN